MFDDNNFVVFPALGYWEIDGKPVSSEEARAVGWMAGGAKWVETEVSRKLTMRAPDQPQGEPFYKLARKLDAAAKEVIEKYGAGG